MRDHGEDQDRTCDPALLAAPGQLKALDEFIAEAQLKNDLAEWRRGRAVRAYIDGRPVINIAADWGVTRGR